MTEEMKKELIKAHLYGVPNDKIAEIQDVPLADVAAALSDIDAVEEEALYLREMGADI